jgi:hypothetical protein
MLNEVLGGNWGVLYDTVGGMAVIRAREEWVIWSVTVRFGRRLYCNLGVDSVATTSVVV